MILDDGGDATHVMVKKYPAIFKLLKVKSQGFKAVKNLK
jgi:S-adenosylhomocysteine hydrolase